ncbi:MAG: tryptophan synthase subunit alpha [Chloroflexota bacterium]
MSRIASVFSRSERKALIAYVTVGYPSVEATLAVVPLLVECGCDLIELGIPFSDPLADGPTIQKSSAGALRNGVTPATCLAVARALSGVVDVPLVFMTYCNPILSYGVEAFCADSAAAGVDGLIVPDLPPEEADELEAAAGAHGLDPIYLLAPTSRDDRVQTVAERSRGFVYLVSVTGVTGARQTLPTDLAAFVARVRARTHLPLCVGFGVSTAAQARQVAEVADGVIVGSRIISLMEVDDGFSSLREFVTGLRHALDEAAVPLP